MALLDLSHDNFQDTVTAQGLVLVDCWAAWCGPCQRFGPIFEKASQKHQDVTFGKLDTEANQEIAASLGISSIPTVLMFRDGILVFRNSGVLSDAQLDDLIQKGKTLDMDAVREQLDRQQNPPAPTKRF